MKNNDFEIVFRYLRDFRDSEIPADRLFYLKSMKQLITMGEKLNQLSPNTETQERVRGLRDKIKDYKLYPKL